MLVPRPAAIRACGVTVRFGAVTALRNVDFEVRPGTIHALVGENGAGKSTLMRTLSGAVMPAEGALELDGVPVTFGSPRAARDAGVRMIHQELSLIPALSVAENIFLGAAPSRHGILDRARMRADARALLSALGETIDPDAPVATLSLARREMVEIAKALTGRRATGLPVNGSREIPAGQAATEREARLDASRIRVLILDEPTAILSARETDALFVCIRSLRDAGVGIVYCSHRLEEIAILADEITVLRDGVRVAHGDAPGMTRDAILGLMVDRGGDGPPRQPGDGRRIVPKGADVLRVEGLSTPVVHDVTMTVRSGEIVALVGLVGAGRTELARAIVGADPRQRGSVVVDGRPANPRNPGDAMRAGVAYVSEDRRAGGLVPQGSVEFNITLARLRSFANRTFLPVIDAARERSAAAEWVDALRIKTAGLDQPVVRLSGGNQQKVVLARWLIPGEQPVRVLIADEPTRGVDAGARSDIHALLRGLAADGMAVVAITSDLTEAFALAERLVVMREGRITGSLPAESTTSAHVAALMVPE